MFQQTSDRQDFVLVGLGKDQPAWQLVVSTCLNNRYPFVIPVNEAWCDDGAKSGDVLVLGNEACSTPAFRFCGGYFVCVTSTGYPPTTEAQFLQYLERTAESIRDDAKHLEWIARVWAINE